MARFVMLRFEDNKTAEEFVKATQEHATFYGVATEAGRDEIENGLDSGFKYVATDNVEAVALWADPTKLCECHPPWVLPNRKTPGAGLTCTPLKSKNYGWLVCSQCNKPHPFQVQHPKNLLAPDEERTYYLGFRADRKKQGEV